MIKKYIFVLLSKLKGNSFGDEWNEVKKIKSEKDLSDTQEKYLKVLLLHAYRNVPYYNKVLEKANVIKKDEIDLHKFNIIPLLTKEIMRRREKLTSKDYATRKWCYNSSGGSTGEPVRFIQDDLFSKWRSATLRYYYENIVGIDELGVKKVLLWGSERDLFEGTIGLRAKAVNWLANTMFLNSFCMTQRDIEHYVKIINSYKPDLIRGYASSLYELCRFIERNNITIHRPKVVISAAERLRDEVREKIESVFEVKVYDFYGSREVNAIAGECNSGLMHIFMFNNYVEVLDEYNKPVKEGKIGKITITTLHNYSMPLIRYEIGDTAILGPKNCKCGNPLPTLKRITGRITDHFIKEGGTIVHGEYFTHLFYLKDWVEAFQIVQEDYKKVRVFIVPRDVINESEKREIENKIKLVMEQDCVVNWEFVEKIPKTQSGKYLYTKSLLYQA